MGFRKNRDRDGGGFDEKKGGECPGMVNLKPRPQWPKKGKRGRTLYPHKEKVDCGRYFSKNVARTRVPAQEKKSPKSKRLQLVTGKPESKAGKKPASVAAGSVHTRCKSATREQGSGGKGGGKKGNGGGVPQVPCKTWGGKRGPPVG